MTPAEYESLPGHLKFDVRVARACGYTMGQIKHHLLGLPAMVKHGEIWRYWSPTTDPTIWTALMDYKDRCHLAPRTHRTTGASQYWEAWFGNARGDLSNVYLADIKGEAVCAAFVAAYGRE